MDPLDELDNKEHSDLWFWWRDQDFFGGVADFFAIAWDTAKIPLCAIVFFVTIFVLANYADNQSEADPWDYREVARWTEEYPEMSPLVESILEDDVLTVGEHEDLKDVYDEIDRLFSLERARETIDEILQQQ